MKIKCPACEDWYFESEEIKEWTICPNCDFPAKFIEWIRRLKSEINELNQENKRLSAKLTNMVNIINET